MPVERRCLVPGCACHGYAASVEDYNALEEEEDMLESEKDELPSYCAQCGHTEMEHELAPWD
jgi:hypothetical protein